MASGPLWNVAREGDSTISLGNLYKCVVTHRIKVLPRTQVELSVCHPVPITVIRDQLRCPAESCFPVSKFLIIPENLGCEDFTKKIECFYRCSPHAARWIHPNDSAAIQAVPLCQSFCDDWYEACKDDSTCVRNWLTDWEWDKSGENQCKSKCAPYREVYANGTDMCQSMWGESFKVSESSCLCLQMNKKDSIAIKYLLTESSEESSSSSSSSSSEEHACKNKLLKFEKLKQKEGEQTR
ncbi:hypothetical protein HGM15179_007610 [Zosterops borbonicus]|uniref:Folate receptor-like domain-containing protein n=1 Tax=Zosterops borbonicus TaxID=364589 RepID=A0A8K1GJ77_9PASS|nr:hypothetical protein HGM15179_007610 [Zosterops borbonicus]